jgi:hypothetical protein
MCAHAPVDAGAPNADEYAQIPARPSRIYLGLASCFTILCREHTLIALAIRTLLVAFQLQEVLDGLGVACCPLRSRIWRSPRHNFSLIDWCILNYVQVRRIDIV